MSFDEARTILKYRKVSVHNNVQRMADAPGSER